LTQALHSYRGDRGHDLIEISDREVEQLCEDLRAGAAPGKLIERAAAWRCEPVGVAFQRLAEHARALSVRLGRGDLIVEWDDGGLRLDPKRWGPLWSEMVHLVRNAVDHGLENQEERRAAGKSRRPRLRLAARVEAGALVIDVVDDGRGIDWESIRRSAERLGLPAASESELLAALLAPGVSSRHSTTELSGRGIGMAALHSRVQELRGAISVTSQAGIGTAWRLRFALPVAGLPSGAGGDVARDAAAPPLAVV
jgi:two-component system chemotaxis sensor kinase CheA